MASDLRDQNLGDDKENIIFDRSTVITIDARDEEPRPLSTVITIDARDEEPHPLSTVITIDARDEEPRPPKLPPPRVKKIRFASKGNILPI